MLDQLPIELRFHIFGFTTESLYNLALTSRLFASEVSVYLGFRLGLSLRLISCEQEIEDDERDLLLRFRRSDGYDAFVLCIFGNRFFTLPPEFSLRVRQVSKLPPLELGLIQYRFPGRELYNTFDLEAIERFLDRSLDVGVDSNRVHHLNIFTHVDRVRSGPLYQNIVILNGTTIRYNFLYNCISLKTLILPTEVTSIKNRFLCRCTSLKRLTLPTRLTSIGDGFLWGCTSLTTLTLPSGMTSFGNWFLNRCTSLTSLNIPSGMTSIGDGFLCDCTSLTSLNIPDEVTSIGDCFLGGCKSLTSLTLPSGVTSIGSGVLSGCESLTSLNIPDGVTSIGCWFLYKCTSLTSLNIPDGVTSIGDGFLCDCTSLTTIDTPDGPFSKEAYNASR